MPDIRNVGFGLYPLPSCAFHAPLYIIVAEEELHALFLVPLDVDHNASVCGGCSILVVLNVPCKVAVHFFFITAYYTKQAFAEVFGSLAMCNSISLQTVSWIAIT